jgi:hypothetical protein
MGQADRGRVKEQVEEKLCLAELKDKEVSKLDISAKDIQERVQALQVRMNRYDQIKREQRRQVAELGQDVERAKLEVAARRQEASRLEALREVLRGREEECNKEKDRLNIKTRREGPAKDRPKEDAISNTNTEMHDNDAVEEDSLHHLVVTGGHTKEAEGQQRGRDPEDNASGANSNKEAEPVINNDVNETIGINKRRAKTGRCGKDHARKIAKTRNGTNIDDDEEEQERQGVDGGKDIQAREEQEEWHHGANGNVPTNDPHHSTHGAPSEGHDEGEQERQVVDGGKDIQAREELEEGHHGTNGPTREEGEGDEQGTRAGGRGGRGDGGM